jgi:glycosyltransferase involved in cell wall biosynthesis
MTFSIVHYWGGCPQTSNSKWRRFLAIVERCGEEGWWNYLVWSRMPEDPALVEPFRDAGCEIILQPRSGGNFDFASVWRTYKLLRRVKCDVFHCHNDHTSPLIGATLARVPVRVWSKLAMSSYYEQGVAPKGIHRLQPSVRLSSMLAHRIHTVSDAVQEELIDLGVSADKVKTLRCPIDLARYDGADGSKFRAELGVSRQDLLVTAVGHAVAVKGWDVLVRAFTEVAGEFPHVHLGLVGSIDSTEECEFAQMIDGLVRQAGLTGRIRLVGRRSDIPACLAGSDVFVLPSRSEGQPLALMEAMASGLPCVAAAVGGIPETIRHGENGLLFAREDVDQLTDRLRQVLSDVTLCLRLSGSAKQSSKAFGIETYVEALFSLYCDLLENGGQKTRLVRGS